MIDEIEVSDLLLGDEVEDVRAGEDASEDVPRDQRQPQRGELVADEPGGDGDDDEAHHDIELGQHDGLSVVAEGARPAGGAHTEATVALAAVIALFVDRAETEVDPGLGVTASGGWGYM